MEVNVTGGRAARDALDRVAREDAGGRKCYACGSWMANGEVECPTCGKAQPDAPSATLTDDLTAQLQHTHKSPQDVR